MCCVKTTKQGGSMGKLQTFEFDDLEEAQEKFPDFNFDDLKDQEESAGKHDCTNYYGYAFNEEGTLAYSVSYSCSYNWGIDCVIVLGPYKVEEEEVTITRYKYTPVEK
jgi:hypothetical protein